MAIYNSTFSIAERYKVMEELGAGAFGVVRKAVNRQTREVVAIKKIRGRKFSSLCEGLDLPEVKSLRKLKHPNIVKLEEAIIENGELYLVFEYMENNLLRVMKDMEGKGKYFPEKKVRNLCYQLLQALAYMHRHRYFHRDLKPENLLITHNIVKVADFGQAKKFCSRPPYTDYVTTRWYRAPELILKSCRYSAPIDMWAMGTIMFELFTSHPMFPGNSEADQLYKICELIGTPNESTWSNGLKLASDVNFSFPQLHSMKLSELIPHASPEAIDLMTHMCLWDPNRRLTASQALKHPFFQAERPISPYILMWRAQYAKQKICIPCGPDIKLCPEKRIIDKPNVPFSLDSVLPAPIVKTKQASHLGLIGRSSCKSTLVHGSQFNHQSFNNYNIWEGFQCEGLPTISL